MLRRVTAACLVFVWAAQLVLADGGMQQGQQQLWPPSVPSIHPQVVPDAYGGPQALMHGGLALGYMNAVHGAPSAYAGKTPDMLNGQEASGSDFYRQALPNGMNMKVPMDYAAPGTPKAMADIMNSHVLQQGKLLEAIHSAEVDAHSAAQRAAVAAMNAKQALWHLQQARRAAHFSRGVLASLHRELAALDLSKERVVEQAHLNALQNQQIATESLIPFGGTDSVMTSPLSGAITKSKKMIDAINKEIRTVLSPKDAPVALKKYQEAEKKEEEAHKTLEAAAKLREESDAANTVYAPDLIAKARMKLVGMIQGGSGSGSAAGSAFRFAEEQHQAGATAAGAAAAATTAETSSTTEEQQTRSLSDAESTHAAETAKTAATAHHRHHRHHKHKAAPRQSSTESSSLSASAPRFAESRDKTAASESASTASTAKQGPGVLAHTANEFRFREAPPTAQDESAGPAPAAGADTPAEQKHHQKAVAPSTPDAHDEEMPGPNSPSYASQMRANLGNVFGPAASDAHGQDLFFSRFKGGRPANAPAPPSAPGAPIDHLRGSDDSPMAPLSPQTSQP